MLVVILLTLLAIFMHIHTYIHYIHTYHYIHTITYIPLHTITNHYKPLHTITNHYKPLHTITYHYIPLHTYIHTYHYIPLHTITYHYIHTYITYITYITLHTLHYIHYITYITLHTLHYIHYITYITLHTLHYIHTLHTYIHYITYIHTYKYCYQNHGWVVCITMSGRWSTQGLPIGVSKLVTQHLRVELWNNGYVKAEQDDFRNLITCLDQVPIFWWQLESYYKNLVRQQLVNSAFHFSAVQRQPFASWETRCSQAWSWADIQPVIWGALRPLPN